MAFSARSSASSFSVMPACAARSLILGRRARAYLALELLNPVLEGHVLGLELGVGLFLRLEVLAGLRQLALRLRQSRLEFIFFAPSE